METGRGRKGKKAGWHLTLGLKETIFAGIGVVGLMMMSFALGALAGRGDIYRAAYSWGLMSPEMPKVAHWTAPAGPPAATPAPDSEANLAAPVTTPKSVSAAAAAPAACTPANPVAAQPAQESSVTGDIAALAPAAEAKKKTKSSPHHDTKSREEEMQRLRQEVAQKLKFQNSFDIGPRPAKAPHKTQVAGVTKKGSAPVKVAQFRDDQAARQKVAELQKKGIKATLKTTKDAKGTLYVVYQPAPSSQQGPEKLAKKPEKGEKGSGTPLKPRVE